MADKEATVYIVDLGSSMGEKHNGRDESDLDWAMQYVWDKITSTVRLWDGQDNLCTADHRQGCYWAQDRYSRRSWLEDGW